MTKTAEPLDWGTSREMNGLEALMWRAEADPRLRSTMCALEELDTTPHWDRLIAAHDWGSRLVPRFRRRVQDPALGLGAPVWVNDPDFDLHYHLRRVRLPEGSGFAGLLAAAVQVGMTPFDRARPLWEAVLFEGLPDGRSAYLLKMHHSATDGLGSVQLLSELHSRTREPSPDKAQVPPPAPEHVTATRALAGQALQTAGALPGAIAGGGRTALRAFGDPARTLRFGRSLRRVLADPDAEASPLLAQRSLSWRWIALDMAFADLRAASKAAGGSLNDAYVAALLGGFRRYHDELGVPLERMPVAIPMSVRSDGDVAGGNRFAGARLALPAGMADPAERIAAVGDAVRAARSEPALNALGFVAPGLARLPAPLISQLAGGLTRNNDLQATNIPGLREDVYIAGAKIERVYGFGPLPGCATMVSLISHGDRCCVGVNLDPAAVTEPERFARCLVEGFEEVLALAENRGPVTLRY